MAGKARSTTPEKPRWQALVAAHSPYLADLLPLGVAPDFGALLEEPAPGLSTQDLMHDLRARKRRAALTVAARDLAGEWDDMEAAAALSRFADFCVRAALRHLLRQAHAEGKITLPDPGNPEDGCAVSVIALGKWGAHELNYSSDIDFMVLFDRDRAPVADADAAQAFYTRLARALARIIDQPDDNGYVFRTDLRLRPDPGATPLAVSLAAAETYYTTLGQNWERAAMIKARGAAGDARLARDFAALMEKWVWRRNLDFAAIQDIHSIKRQVSARHGAGGKDWTGFNVKLGHGGIRDIEFFVQTQQLVFGGRAPALRARATLDALAALRAHGHIDARTEEDLRAAYLFLRRTEHRLQMQNDLQTHSLPATQDGIAGVAAFTGYAAPAAFLADMERHTARVRAASAALFPESPSLAGAGSLVFTGVEDDPETLETLRKMGFAEPGRVTAAVRAWHHGRARAVRSERARQALTELAPHLLRALARTSHPDEAFLNLDGFIHRLPAGVPVFSLFMNKPDVLELVAQVMGESPAMAAFLGAHPEALDGVITRDFLSPLPDAGHLAQEAEAETARARDYEDTLDLARRFVREQRFRTGLHILKNLSPDAECRRCFADTAQAALGALVPRIEAEFEKTHGRFRTGAYVILGMGSFGARQMFADSDLDIVALYDTDEAEKESDGPRPLPPSTYYTRLTQRLVAALEAPTAEGVMYAADLRLRPHGDKGPLAARLDGFLRYHREEAWIWEHMSLVRARPVYGGTGMRARVQEEITRLLCVPRDARKLKAEMAQMREKVEKQFGSRDPWHLKYARGGLMDVMFVAHYHALKHAHEHPGILRPGVGACLDALLEKGLIPAGDHRALAAAHEKALAVTSFLRLCAELPFHPETAARGMKQALVRRAAAGGAAPSFRDFAAELEKDRAASFTIFEKVFR